VPLPSPLLTLPATTATKQLIILSFLLLLLCWHNLFREATAPFGFGLTGTMRAALASALPFAVYGNFLLPTFGITLSLLLLL
jgi:hypothetical protein